MIDDIGNVDATETVWPECLSWPTLWRWVLQGILAPFGEELLTGLARHLRIACKKHYDIR